MSTENNPLAELIRKVDSNVHDPKIHGDGFLITWHKKKREVLKQQSILGSLFDKKNHEYYFVKAHTKPLVSKLPFEWHEGTSDIALDFDATFQLRVSERREAEQLVTTLSQTGSVEYGLQKLIDKYLHSCMSQFYARVSQTGKNLLDIFYQGQQHQGESAELNENVSSFMRSELKGADFAIGFTLRNAPQHQAYFNHQSKINETDLNVDSECRLVLTNYQAYRKSGINNIDEVEQHMKSGIEVAIKQHILGKSLMELLSNFKTALGDKPSISDQIKASVRQHALKIGYELESLHTLPDIAPLHLLTGLTVEFSESDGTFKTKQFGGGIKLNIRLVVKAIESQFEKHKDLLCGETEQAVDPNISIGEIVRRIKTPIFSVCKEVMRQHTHLDAANSFDKVVREGLENAIKENLKEQHGLSAVIKLLEPAESEEASRLEELRYKKRAFSFEHAANNGDVNSPLVTFTGGFEVTNLNIEDLNCWDAFESHDFGYRSESSVRTVQGDDSLPEAPHDKSASDYKAQWKAYDRQWKNIAIERELESIEDEIIRFFKASALFLLDPNDWIHDPKYNRQVQQELLKSVQDEIRKNRGLLINLERLAVSDKSLLEARLAARTRRLEQLEKTEQLKGQQKIENMKLKHQQRIELEDVLLTRKKELIEDNVEDFADWEEQQEKVAQDYDTGEEREDSLDDFLPKNKQLPESQQALLNDLTNNEPPQTTTIDE